LNKRPSSKHSIAKGSRTTPSWRNACSSPGINNYSTALDDLPTIAAPLRPAQQHIDGVPSPPDWMPAFPEQQALLDDVLIYMSPLGRS
jgi:hypothetical protein